MKRAAMFVVAFAICGCKEYPPDGVYVGSGEGSYRKGHDTPVVTFTIPGDTVKVGEAGRHDQHSSVKIEVRGCTTGGEGDLSTWSVPNKERDGTCTFDIPGLGPTALKSFGGLSREPTSPNLPPDAIHLRLASEAATDKTAGALDQFSYKITAKRKK